MGDLTCTSWPSYGNTSARCQYCGWPAVDPSPAKTAQAARAHAIETGHTVRTTHVQVTEYRYTGTLPLETIST